MPRNPGTNRSGSNFSDAMVQAVWERGTIIPGFDRNKRRMDACSAWIDRHLYGVTTHLGFGWEIDHIVPVSKGGSDSLINLQPLQWQNNREKADGLLACAAFAPTTT